MPDSVSIVMPEAPAIPGLHFRRFGGKADLPDIASVINASLAADGSSDRITAGGLANIYAHPVHWDPQQDTLLAEINGVLIGCANTEWRQEDDGGCLHSINLHLVEKWRGRGLELAMQHHMERCARAAAAAIPDVRHWFVSRAADTWPARAAMLRSLDYAPARRYFEMQRPLDDDLPEVVLPSGIAFRPVLPEQFRAIWEAGEECFRDQQDYVVPIEEHYYAWIADPDLDPSMWLVAWAGDQVAGAAINVIHRGSWGETDDLFVRRPWRKQGLGRALLAGSLRLFKARGLANAGLGVDAENSSGALGLYERVGYRVYQRVAAYRKGM